MGTSNFTRITWFCYGLIITSGLFIFLMKSSDDDDPSFENDVGYKAIPVDSSTNKSMALLQACEKVCPSSATSCNELEKCFKTHKENCQGVTTFCPVPFSTLLVETFVLLVTWASLALVIGSISLTVWICFKMQCVRDTNCPCDHKAKLIRAFKTNMSGIKDTSVAEINKQIQAITAKANKDNNAETPPQTETGPSMV